MRVNRLLAVCAAFMLIAPAAAGADSTVAVIGDTPYGADQIAEFPADVAAINADPAVGLVMHLGDIKNGSTWCTDEYLASIRGQFDAFEDPLVYTPGDNEWTDCHRASNGGDPPPERPPQLRGRFFCPPGGALGLQARAGGAPPRRPRNARVSPSG